MLLCTNKYTEKPFLLSGACSWVVELYFLQIAQASASLYLLLFSVCADIGQWCACSQPAVNAIGHCLVLTNLWPLSHSFLIYQLPSLFFLLPSSLSSLPPLHLSLQWFTTICVHWWGCVCVFEDTFTEYMWLKEVRVWQFVECGSAFAYPWGTLSLSLLCSVCAFLCVCVRTCVCACTVERWGTEEVGIWLEQLSLGEYRDTFIRHDIRGSELLHLERRDLKVLSHSHTHIHTHTHTHWYPLVVTSQWICVNPLLQSKINSFSLYPLGVLRFFRSVRCLPVFATSRAALHRSAWLLPSDRGLLKKTCCNPLTLYTCWKGGEAFRSRRGSVWIDQTELGLGQKWEKNECI